MWRVTGLFAREKESLISNSFRTDRTYLPPHLLIFQITLRCCLLCLRNKNTNTLCLFSTSARWSCTLYVRFLSFASGVCSEYGILIFRILFESFGWIGIGQSDDCRWDQTYSLFMQFFVSINSIFSIHWNYSFVSALALQRQPVHHKQIESVINHEKFYKCDRDGVRIIGEMASDTQERR